METKEIKVVQDHKNCLEFLLTYVAKRLKGDTTFLDNMKFEDVLKLEQSYAKGMIDSLKAIEEVNSSFGLEGKPKPEARWLDEKVNENSEILSRVSDLLVCLAENNNKSD